MVESEPRYPEFVEFFGLLPPFSVEDLDAAYAERAKAPNGPSLQLEDAYQRAVHYLAFHASRRTWLGEQIEQYELRREFVEEIRSIGGRAELEPPETYLSTLGPDFGDVARRLTEIKLVGIVSPLLGELLDESWLGDELIVLDLARTDAGEDDVRRLQGSKRLVALDLRGTPGGHAIADVVEGLPSLAWVHVGETSLGRGRRSRLAKTLPGLHVETDMQRPCPSGSKLNDVHVRIARRTMGR